MVSLFAGIVLRPPAPDELYDDAGGGWDLLFEPFWSPSFWIISCATLVILWLLHLAQIGRTPKQVWNHETRAYDTVRRDRSDSLVPLPAIAVALLVGVSGHFAFSGSPDYSAPTRIIVGLLLGGLWAISWLAVVAMIGMLFGGIPRDFE